jgi:non-heme chloroperoxidase
MTHLLAIRRPRLRCEVTRYVGRHGSDRVAKVVLLGAIPAADAQDRRQPQRHPQFYQDLSEPFYGANRPGMQVGLKGAYDCSKAFSETDLTQDLPADRRADPDRPRRRRPDRPHQRLGSAVGGAGPRRHPEGVPGRPRAGPGGPDQDQFNTDLLDFLRT